MFDHVLAPNADVFKPKHNILLTISVFFIPIPYQIKSAVLDRSGGQTDLDQCILASQEPQREHNMPISKFSWSPCSHVWNPTIDRWSIFLDAGVSNKPLLLFPWMYNALLMYPRFLPEYHCTVRDVFSSFFNKWIYSLDFYREQRGITPLTPLLINHKSAPMFFWEMVFTAKKPKQGKKCDLTPAQPVVVESWN